MIRLPNVVLDPATQALLDALQADVDAQPTYVRQVARGKLLFTRRNRPNDAVFRVVRAALDGMCSGARRCCYCEDSARDQVEHIRPKDLYPELVFVWENYLYACGICNRDKNARYAVFSTATGELTPLAQVRNTPVPPIRGADVFIDPRREDPQQFIALDIETFRFLPLGVPGSQDRQRAEYTIDVLKLNAREELVEAREEAYHNFRARLAEYVQAKAAGRTPPELTNMENAIRRMRHPTVWREMKRRQAQIAELTALFAQAPESLDW
jgi:uncharacterized protein (TIGR02646 family)